LMAARPLAELAPAELEALWSGAKLKLAALAQSTSEGAGE